MRDFVIARLRAFLRAADTLQWLPPLVLRLFWGYFWAETGWAKLQNIDTFTERFMGWGIPFPMFSATVSGLTDLAGGLCLMLGLFTRLATIPMMVNMAVAIALVNIRDVHSFDDFVELNEFLYLLVLFWLLVAGPGRVSVDHWLKQKLGLSPER